MFSLELIPIALVLFAAALTRSTFGFGEALVAMPLLTLIVDIRVAAALVAMTSIVNAVAILSTSWQTIQWRPARRLVLSAMLGIPLGVFALVSVPVIVVKAVLAVLVISFAVYNLWHPELCRIKSDGPAYIFGGIAGVLGGAYNTMGPPLVIFGTLRRWPADQFRSTLQAVFLPGSLFVVANHIAYRVWNAEVLRCFLVSLPFILIATVLGHYFNERLGGPRFARLVYVVLLVIGTMLLITVVAEVVTPRP